MEKRGCLSSEPHGWKDIVDFPTHYLGCLEQHERETFFSDEEFWSSVPPPKLALQKVSAAVSIAARLKRIHVLRKAIDKEDFIKLGLRRARSNRATLADPRQKKRLRDERPNLVGDVQEKLGAWRSSPVYAEGIQRVRTWRQRDQSDESDERDESDQRDRRDRRDRRDGRDGQERRTDKSSNRNSVYGKKGIPTFDYAGGVESERQASQKEASQKLAAMIEQIRDLEKNGIDGRGLDYELKQDINARVICFSLNEKTSVLDPHDIDASTSQHVKGIFPDQRLSLKHLLAEDKLLGANDKYVRYIHIPANNMLWVEELIAAYYDEPPSNLSHANAASRDSRAAMLLRPQLWRGQQHSGHDGLTHTRHMRPICEMVSSDPTRKEDMPNNVVLYMPYLHWEMDRKREAVADMINARTLEHLREARDSEVNDKARRQKRREGLLEGQNSQSSQSSQSKVHQASKRSNYSSAHTLLGPRFRRRRATGSGRSPLAQLLLSAVRLYEAMSNYRDKKIIDEYLFAQPPLHPRRTLDQSHFWSLESLKSQSQQQVLYRDTNTEENAYLPRLVMVDQLWMWILNKDTIITCFPQRYGANDQDDSDVHRSIRERMKRAHRNQFRSVYDIALVIIDECSNTFFERIKTAEDIPQLLTIFARAIGSTIEKQKISMNRVQAWTDMASTIYRIQGAVDQTEQLRNSLLDVKPEIDMQRDIRVVIEELNTMLHVHRTQNDLATRFCRHVTELLQTSIAGLGVAPKTAKRQRFNSFMVPSRQNSVTDLSSLSRPPSAFDLSETSLPPTLLPPTVDFKPFEMGPREPREGPREPREGPREMGPKDTAPRKEGPSDGHPSAGSSSRHNPPSRLELPRQDSIQMGLLTAEPSEQDSQMYKITAKQLQLFKEEGKQLTMGTRTRIQELQELKSSAEQTETGMNSLLELKRQQANAFLAWQAVRQADVTVKQGRSVMIFTIITIIFVPMSFISSVFGMNNREFGSQNWELVTQFNFIFSISLGIIVLVMVVNSDIVRTIVPLTYRHIEAKLRMVFLAKVKQAYCYLDQITESNLSNHVAASPGPYMTTSDSTSNMTMNRGGASTLTADAFSDDQDAAAAGVGGGLGRPRGGGGGGTSVRMRLFSWPFTVRLAQRLHNWTPISDWKSEVFRVEKEVETMRETLKNMERNKEFRRQAVDFLETSIASPQGDPKEDRTVLRGLAAAAAPRPPRPSTTLPLPLSKPPKRSASDLEAGVMDKQAVVVMTKDPSPVSSQTLH